jgi:hypothetical protein
MAVDRTEAGRGGHRSRRAADGTRRIAISGFSARVAEAHRGELSRDGIVVTTVIPGFMRTGSYLAARFKGDTRKEYPWVAILGNLPLTSMSAERAAARVVLAAERGEAEVGIGWEGKVLSRVAGVAPGLTADLLGVLNRTMPRPGPAHVERTGAQSETALTRSFLTRLGQRAAARYLQEDSSATEATS